MPSKKSRSKHSVLKCNDKPVKGSEMSKKTQEYRISKNLNDGGYTAKNDPRNARKNIISTANEMKL